MRVALSYRPHFLLLMTLIGFSAFRTRGLFRSRSLLASLLSSAVHKTTADAATDRSEALQNVRSYMKKHLVDALIVPTEDPHMSEYTAACFGRREFISGFTGSAGTAVITTDKALLFTDGRYHSQAEKELDANWTLMKVGVTGVPTPIEYLTATLARKTAVAVDPAVHSAESYKQLQEKLRAKDISIFNMDTNAIDLAWGTLQPALPTSAVREHPMEYAGQSVAEKLALLRAQMKEQETSALVVSMLDEIAWLFNIRGGDVECNPVALSYALVTQDAAHLFISMGKVPAKLVQTLRAAGVEIRPYESFVAYLRDYVTEDASRTVWMDGRTASQAIFNTTAANQRVDQLSPIVLLKACKNAAELWGMRACHLRDGAAVVEFLAALDAHFHPQQQGQGGNREAAAATPLSEVQLADKLQAFRARCERFVGPSFDTIAGVNENGAIIHYRAKAGTCKVLTGADMLLLDSGAQYLDGTTDVTRTLHMGTPTAYQKEMFTRVLKGHIALDVQSFPPGTPGCLLDTLARQHLWAAGKNYLHGTGHGVGAALNVHEGPQRISAVLNAQPLLPGMIVSNEPGYYEPGNFGIRIENLLEVVERPNGYLGFKRLTSIPMQEKLMDKALMTDSELAWVNSYHAEVREKVMPQVQSDAARAWLHAHTQPIAR